MPDPNAQDTITASPVRREPFVFCDARNPPAGVVVFQFPHPFTSLDEADPSRVRRGQ